MSDDEYEAWRKEQAAKQADKQSASKPAPAPPATPPIAAVEPSQHEVDPTIRNPLENVFGGPAGIEMDDGTEAPEETEVLHGEVEGPDAEALAAYKEATEKKGEAVWYVVVGVAMLFMASFHWGIGAGGVLMVLWGGFRYAQWAGVARHAYDPWEDADIDAWEEKEMDAEA